MTLTLDPGPAIVAAVVLVGSAFLFGVLIGGELQKHILHGHEGTRAETLRRRQAQRARSISQKRIELYGLRPAVPEPRRPEQDRWWLRHPGEPVDRSPDSSDSSDSEQ